MRLAIYTSRSVNQEWDHIWSEDSVERNQAKMNYPEFEAPFKRIKKSDRILEAGVGLGRWLEHFHSKGYAIQGIDYSEEAIAQLKKHNPDYDVRYGDIRALPFEDDSFDVYLSFGVLEHLESSDDLAKSIREMHRILRPGGLAFVSIPYLNAHNAMYALRNRLSFSPLLNRLRRRRPPTQHFFEYNYSKRGFLRNIDFKNDFKLVDCIPENIPLILRRYKRFTRGMEGEHKFDAALNREGSALWHKIVNKPNTSIVRNQFSHLILYLLQKR